MRRRFVILKSFLRVAVAPFFLLLLVGCSSVVQTKELFTSDRRSDGTRYEDLAIQLKAKNRLRDQLGEDRSRPIHVSSFNRTALITGFVTDTGAKSSVGQIVARIENVRFVVNELFVGPPSVDASAGINKVFEDRVLCEYGRAGFDTRVAKVVVESGTVFLMGLASAEEARRHSQLAARTPGVRRVVQVFEVITEEQAKAIDSAGLGIAKGVPSTAACASADANRHVNPSVTPIQRPRDIPPASQEAPQLPAPAPRALDAQNIELAKGKCAALGLKVGSEKFGECVLRLTK